MKYKFSYRRSGRFFWHTRKVKGHSYDKDQDKMVLIFEGDGLQEIAKWSKHECKLDIDWVVAEKNRMEQEAGQSIPIKT